MWLLILTRHVTDDTNLRVEDRKITVMNSLLLVLLFLSHGLTFKSSKSKCRVVPLVARRKEKLQTFIFENIFWQKLLDQQNITKITFFCNTDLPEQFKVGENVVLNFEQNDIGYPTDVYILTSRGVRRCPWKKWWKNRNIF